MPALTNSRFGSSNGSGTLGTTACPLRSKCPRNRARISADFTVPLCQTGSGGLLGRGGTRRAVQAGRLPQFQLALGHRLADVGGEVADRLDELAQRAGDPA